MKYLVISEPENNQKCYASITFFGSIQQGVMFDESFVLHLAEGLICEISSEFYNDVVNKFLSNNTFIDVTEYIAKEKAIVVNLRDDLWDDEEDDIPDGMNLSDENLEFDDEE